MSEAPVMLVELLLAAALADPRTVAAAKAVEKASADDCRVLAEILKRRLVPEDAAFYPQFDRPDGGVYVESCPWRTLGAPEPKLQTPDSKVMFYMTRPSYDARRTRGAVAVTYSLQAEARVDGKKPPAFIKQYDCRLERRQGRWSVVSCDDGPVT